MRALYKIVMRVVGGSTAELNELVTGIELPSRLRKKTFRSLLSLSVVSPRGGELKEASFIAGFGKIFHKEIGFSAPC